MKLSTKNNSIYRVQAVERALDILDCFNFQNKELSLSEVVDRTGLNKTTAKRLIANLTSRGYLQQDPQSKNHEAKQPARELSHMVNGKKRSLRDLDPYPQGCSHL